MSTALINVFYRDAVINLLPGRYMLFYLFLPFKIKSIYSVCAVHFCFPTYAIYYAKATKIKKASAGGPTFAKATVGMPKNGRKKFTPWNGAQFHRGHQAFRTRSNGIFEHGMGYASTGSAWRGWASPWAGECFCEPMSKGIFEHGMGYASTGSAWRDEFSFTSHWNKFSTSTEINSAQALK